MSQGWYNRLLKQKAVWWKAGDLDRFGRPSYLAPVEVPVRWEEKTEQARTPEGTFLKFTTEVFVDRVMEEGDRLKLGPIESNTPDDPTEDQLAIRIQMFKITPDAQNRTTVYCAYL